MAAAYVRHGNAGNRGAVIGAAVGAFLGYLIGSMRGLYYNVQATNALCLKQIEQYTRTG